MGDAPLTVCICGHHLMLHDPTGRCHGIYGISAAYCSCWAYRTPEADALAQPAPEVARWKDAAFLFRANLYQDSDGEGVRMMCRNCEVVDAHDPDCEVLEGERLVGLAAQPQEDT